MVRAFLTFSVIGFKASWFVRSARVLAGVLAAAMLVCGLLATNATFHQALHHDGHATAESCVLCLFAQGLVDSPEPLPVVAAAMQPWVEPAPRLESIALVDFTYLTAPSRAPPAVASLLLAVA